MGMSEVQRLRRGLARSGWQDAFGGAALLFLTMMTAGAALLLAGKLQFPSLGSGASPLDILRAIGLVGLACLGVTIEIGGLSLSAVPLGVVALILLSSARLSADTFRKLRHSWLPSTIKLGVAFALLLALAAYVFRFRGRVPVAASPFEAAALGLIWGAVLGAVGTALVTEARVEPAALARAVRDRVGDGLRTGAYMVRWAAVGSLIALLGLIVGRLALDPLPRSFGVGDALAAILYLVAFLPNALIAVFSLALGATLQIGAQVGVEGSIVGPVRELSLFDGGRGDPPGLLWLLVLLPAAVSVAGGMWAARRSTRLQTVALTIVVGALGFALVVGVLASAADARIGGGLVREQGLAFVAVDTSLAAGLALVWACVGGAAGALIHVRFGSPTGERP